MDSQAIWALGGAVNWVAIAGVKLTAIILVNLENSFFFRLWKNLKIYFSPWLETARSHGSNRGCGLLLHFCSHSDFHLGFQNWIKLIDWQGGCVRIYHIKMIWGEMDTWKDIQPSMCYISELNLVFRPSKSESFYYNLSRMNTIAKISMSGTSL